MVFLSGARLRRHCVQLKRASRGFDVTREALENAIYTYFSPVNLLNTCGMGLVLMFELFKGPQGVIAAQLFRGR